jgi:hypothetical protein
MTIFHVLLLAGLILGAIWGGKLGSHFGILAGVVGGILGACIGFVAGRIPFILVLRCIRRDFTKKSVEELRIMLRDPGCLIPNAVLLELGSRGQDLQPELPVVLDMLAASSRERRIRGWHALASAFPDRAKLFSDYRLDDSPEECQRKVQKLGSVEPGAPQNRGPAMPADKSVAAEGPPSVS